MWSCKNCTYLFTTKELKFYTSCTAVAVKGDGKTLCIRFQCPICGKMDSIYGEKEWDDLSN